MSRMWANSVRSALFAALLVAFGAVAQEERTLGGFGLSEFPSAGATPVFKLVSAGAEPRRELRYRLAAGSTHLMALTMRMSVGVEVEGRAMPPSRVPAMRMLFECKVIEADDQQARFDFAMPSTPELFDTEGIAPTMIEAMRKNLAQLATLRGHVAMTNRGVVRDSHIEIGPTLEPGATQMLQSMQQSMEQTAVPLPPDPVGVGAQWRMLQRVGVSGTTVYQVATFTLTAIEGQVATMSVALEQLAPRQKMALPEKAAGASAELASMEGHGEGRMTVDLRSPVPRSSATVESAMAMNVEAEGKTLRMKMNNRMELQVEPGAKP